ncbi:MAG TPA: hypothetical protein VEB40_06800 [Flavipsychrobacter sp.]|nr:hypothetical protein [Flavipsychrobacter sp.]
MKYLLTVLLLLPIYAHSQKVSLGASGGYAFMGNPGFVNKYGERELNSYYVSGTLAIKLGKSWEVGECASMLRVASKVVTTKPLPGQKQAFKGNYFTAHYANPLFCFSFFFNKYFTIKSFNEKPVQKFYAGLHLGLLLSENALAKTDSIQAKMYNDAKGFNAGLQLGYMLEVSNTVSFTLEATPGYYLIKYTGGVLNNTDFKSAINNVPISLGIRVNI